MKKRLPPALARSKGKRSNLEVRVQAIVDTVGEDFLYESKKFEYTTEHKYLVDWYSEKYDIGLESKGRFMSKDRAKMLRVKKRYPSTWFVLLFQEPYKSIESSDTTYAQWADRHGFYWTTEALARLKILELIRKRIELRNNT